MSPDFINLMVFVGILSVGYWAGRLILFIMEQF